jgi:hypothetical protein
MSIIGIVLGVVAISLFVWLKNDQKMSNDLHEGDLMAAKHAFEALMDDFNNYQIETDRKIAKLEKDMEIRFKSRDRQMDAANKRMDQMNKSLPSMIRNIIGHIEFAKPLDKK